MPEFPLQNEQIAELKYEVAKIQKAHDDLLRVYDTRY
jgi:CRISPR/Cas system-associated endoribonuclease Cas2